MYNPVTQKERGMEHEETSNEEKDGQESCKTKDRQESKKNSKKKGC